MKKTSHDYTHGVKVIANVMFEGLEIPLPCTIVSTPNEYENGVIVDFKREDSPKLLYKKLRGKAFVRFKNLEFVKVK